MASPLTISEHRCALNEGHQKVSNGYTRPTRSTSLIRMTCPIHRSRPTEKWYAISAVALRESGQRLGGRVVCVRSRSVSRLSSGMSDKGPESLLLMLISKDGLNRSVTKFDQIISAQIEGLGDEKIFIAEFAVKDANIIRLHRHGQPLGGMRHPNTDA